MKAPNVCHILIADNKQEDCQILSSFINREGFVPLLAQRDDLALKIIREKNPDLLFLDLQMPKLEGVAGFLKIKSINNKLPVIMTTGYTGIQQGVQAVKAGAYDCLIKPFQYDEVIRMLQQALSKDDEQFDRQQEEYLPQNSLSEMMGPSDVVTQLIANVEQVAKSDFSVIIQGETGSGKEVIAKAIHQASYRAKGAFVPVDCGAIPETLLESELFGYEKGAFTHAERQKPGKFEAAQGGTIFLDEIFNMPLASQVKLLRVLQDKALYHIGGNKSIKVDVRVLVACSKNLENEINCGAFRRDLFYRLNDFTITIPPLRERKRDIVYLAQRFLKITNQELGKKVKNFSKSAMTDLLAYYWPGNVRQLRSTIRRAVLLSEDIITDKHLNMHADNGTMTGKNIPVSMPPPQISEIPWAGTSLKEAMQRYSLAMEREIILQTLKYTGGNKAKAARLLQIDYKTIHTKVKKYNLALEQ